MAENTKNRGRSYITARRNVEINPERGDTTAVLVSSKIWCHEIKKVVREWFSTPHGLSGSQACPLCDAAILNTSPIGKGKGAYRISQGGIQ